MFDYKQFKLGEILIINKDKYLHFKRVLKDWREECKIKNIPRIKFVKFNHNFLEFCLSMSGNQCVLKEQEKVAFGKKNRCKLCKI